MIIKAMGVDKKAQGTQIQQGKNVQVMTYEVCSFLLRALFSCTNNRK